MADHPELTDTERLVQRVLSGLEQRARMRPGSARGALDLNLLEQLRHLERALDGTVAAPRDAPPPRRVATAMALALFAQPHLGVTLGAPGRGGTANPGERGPYPAEAPFAVPNEVLEEALGLSPWELDDLREEVDRRAGAALKRRRALAWMWEHFGLPGARPAPLFRVLFPAHDRLANSAHLAWRGGRLYALVDAPVVPLPALYLGWMGAEQEGAVPPLASFRARYVDDGLRRAMCRAVGGAPHEVERILDRMVALIPSSAARTFLERDQWRVAELSALADLGDDYLGEERLISPVDRDELEWPRWIGARDGAVAIGRPARVVFDELALARTQRVMRQVYAALLARVEQTDEGDEGFAAEDLDLLDLRRHLRAALEPLVAWGRAEASARHVAAHLGVEAEEAARVLGALADEWEEYLRTRWLAIPSDGNRPTIPAILLAHLVATRAALLRAVLRAPDPRWEHRSLALLFAAFYLADAPVERLWIRGLSDMLMDDAQRLPPPEDIVGTWFWPTWQRVLDFTDLDLARTPSL